jgi:thioredoxin 1
MKKTVLPIVAGVLVVGALIGVGVNAQRSDTSTDDAMMKKEATSSASPTPNADEAMKMKEAEAMAMKKDVGAVVLQYTNEAAAQSLVKNDGKDVVYFFSASWCPDCQAIQKRLANADDLAKLGKNTVIISVDYDTQTQLKRKYNVVRQTTFVRIDGEGKSLKQATLGGYDNLLTF